MAQNPSFIPTAKGAANTAAKGAANTAVKSAANTAAEGATKIGADGTAAVKGSTDVVTKGTGQLASTGKINPPIVETTVVYIRNFLLVFHCLWHAFLSTSGKTNKKTSMETIV